MRQRSNLMNKSGSHTRSMKEAVVMNRRRSAPIRLPGFYCPAPAAQHPHAATLTARTRRWMSTRGLAADAEHAERLAAADFGRLVASTIPTGLPRRLQVITDLNAWFHALDGVHGDENLARSSLEDLASLNAEFVHALCAPEGERVGEDRFAAALREIARRVATFASPAQYGDWVAGLQSYFLLEQAERSARASGAVPDLQSYLLYCAHGRAGRPSLTIVPAAVGYRVPSAEMAAPVLRALTAMTSVIVCFDNDLYSWGKERLQAGYVHNLLTVLAARRGCAPLDALEEAVALRDRIMVGMLALLERARPTLSTAALRYGADLLSWISGQVAWGTSSPRFVAPEYDVHIPECWASTPRDTRTDAPTELSTVAWWWTADIAPPAHSGNADEAAAELAC
jgi:hypothetical protein